MYHARQCLLKETGLDPEDIYDTSNALSFEYGLSTTWYNNLIIHLILVHAASMQTLRSEGKG